MHDGFTTASAYLRLLILDVGQLDDIQRSMLAKLASYIVSVYVPSFFCIHLKPPVAEGPGIVLFQRNLLLAYHQVDSEIAEVALKYFYKHAHMWLSPENVALSVFAEVPPYSCEAVKSGSFPDSVNARSRTERLQSNSKDFFNFT